MPRKKYNRKKKGLTKLIKAIADKEINRKQEKKFFDLYSNALAVSAAGNTCQNLVPLSQGAGDQGYRVGDKCDLCGLNYNVTFRIGDTTNIMRMILFQWRSTPGVTPAQTDIMSYGVNAPEAVLSSYNHDNGDRYTILLDKTVNLDSNNNSVMVKRGTLNLSRKKKFRFQGTLNFVSDGSNTTNGIWALFISDSTAAGHPTVDYYFRTTYRDG